MWHVLGKLHHHVTTTFKEARMRVNSAVQVRRRLGELVWSVTVTTVLLAAFFFTAYRRPWFGEGATEFTFLLAIALLLVIICLLFLDRWQLEERAFDRYARLARFDVHDYVMPTGATEPWKLCQVMAITIEATRTDDGVRAEQRIKAHRFFGESFDVFESESDFRHATEEEVQYWKKDCERTRETMSLPPKEWGEPQVA